MTPAPGSAAPNMTNILLRFANHYRTPRAQTREQALTEGVLYGSQLAQPPGEAQRSPEAAHPNPGLATPHVDMHTGSACDGMI